MNDHIVIGPCKCGGYGQVFDEEAEKVMGVCHKTLVNNHPDEDVKEQIIWCYKCRDKGFALQQQIDALKAELRDCQMLSAANEIQECNEITALKAQVNELLTLEEHDRKVHDAGYNKAIDDALEALDAHLIDTRMGRHVIRQLKKQPGWCDGCNPDNCPGGCSKA